LTFGKTLAGNSAKHHAAKCFATLFQHWKALVQNIYNRHWQDQYTKTIKWEYTVLSCRRCRFLWDEVDFEILIEALFDEQDQDFFKFGLYEHEWCLNYITHIISFKLFLLIEW
jgi:hypothetical protein